MALQGTLDTFDLGEVINLLAAGGKTGRLSLSGGRGSGSVWFDEGSISASSTDATDLVTSHADVVFQLLRFEEGSFVFEQDARPDSPEELAETTNILTDATERLGEWREIEAVVPSIDHAVSLTPALDRADVVIDRDRWGAIAVIGDGRSVSAVARALDLDELSVCRLVRDLVELGLVQVSEPAEAEVEADDAPAEPAPSVEPAANAPEDEAWELEEIEQSIGNGHVAHGSDMPAPEPGWVTADDGDRTARDQLDSLASGFGLSDDPVNPMADPAVNGASLAGGPDAGGVPTFDEREGSGVPGDSDMLDFADPQPLAGVEEPAMDAPFPIEEAAASGQATTQLFAEVPAAEPTVDAAVAASRPEPGEAAEVARQLANLSPEAARAVAAAARATSEEEREAALAQVAEDSDQPIDPDLLRKFLSSVNA